MKLTIDLFDRIERYLSNAMPIEERQAFESEMLNSTDLRVLVKEQRVKRQNDLYELEKDLWLNRKNLVTESNHSNISVFQRQIKKFNSIQLLKYVALFCLFLGIIPIIRYFLTEKTTIEPFQNNTSNKVSVEKPLHKRAKRKGGMNNIPSQNHNAQTDIHTNRKAEIVISIDSVNKNQVKKNRLSLEKRDSLMKILHSQ